MPEGKNRNTFPPVKTGMVFGYLEVIEKADPYISPSGKERPRARWKCRCQLCGNEITLTTSALHTRKNKSCGCTDEGAEKPYKPSVTPDMEFGMLRTVRRLEDHYTPSGIKKPVWECECLACGRKVPVQQIRLVQGRKTHCGCLRKSAKKGTPGNTYDLSKGCGIGYTAKGEPFLFDKEDFSKVSLFRWHFDTDGYLRATPPRNSGMGKNPIPLHKLVMPDAPDGMVVDHIKHPPGRCSKRIDNRKQNLRFVTVGQNRMNACLRRDNTSGHVGVQDRGERWKATIKHDGKSYSKYFPHTDEGFKDACTWQEEKAQELFGEYKYQEQNGNIPTAAGGSKQQVQAPAAGSRNKSGHVGVYKDKCKNKWRASITHDGKNYSKYFPYTDDGFKDACAWREEMSEKLTGYKYSGVQQGETMWMATIKSQGITYTECFPLTDDGYESACAWRSEMEKKLAGKGESGLLAGPGRKTDPMLWKRNTPGWKRSDNTSGHTGVSEKENRWLARVKCHGKKYSKRFPLTDEGLADAIQWRVDMKKKLYGTDIESS